MIEVKPFIEDGVVEVIVHGKLESIDFQKVGPVMDEMIEHKGKIKGLLLNITEFEGWAGIEALMTHLKFVKAHHQYIERVAAVGNNAWMLLIPKLVSLFVKAEPRYFDIKNLEQAQKWVRGH